MALTKKQAGVWIAAVLLLAALIAIPFARPAYRRWQEDQRWTLWLDDAFPADPIAHSATWDALNKLLENGGLPLLSWTHFANGKVPRQGFRVRAWFKVSRPQRPAWIQVAGASPVEYFSVADAGSSQELPRSRWAGYFGRLDRSSQGASLSVGQKDVRDQRVNVAVAPTTPKLGEEVLQMTLEDEHLSLSWGTGHVDTLARALFVGQTPELQFGLAGENIIVTRLQVWLRKDPGNLKTEAEADGYALVSKPQMSEPIYRDLALAQTDPSARSRYLLRDAQALALETKRNDAEKLLRDMIFRDPASFYSGYARLDLEKVREDQGAGTDELGAILKGLYQGQPKHPEAGAARLRHAQLLAKDPANFPEARRLALEALESGAPSVETAAIDLLTAASSAIPAEALVGTLRNLAQKPGSSPALSEALAVQEALLQKASGDLSGLAQTCIRSLSLPLDTRHRVYELLADRIEASYPKGTTSAVLELALSGQGANSDYTPHPDLDYMLRDLCAVLGLGHFRSIQSMATVRPALQALAPLLRHHIRLHEGLRPSQTERNWLDLSHPPLPSSYGNLQQAPPSLSDGETCLLFKSGTYWGCGISMEGSQDPRLSTGETDLSGYRFLQADVWAPAGCELFFSLSESGVADPKADSFAGAAGADGEQYLFPGFKGNGEWLALKLPLNDVGPAFNWGNPQGNLTVDLQAIRKVDLAIPGQQGVGRVCLRKLRFTVE